MSTTRAGDLRERVGFYRPNKADDGYGNTEVGFEDRPAFSTVRASIIAKLGGEGVLAGRLTGRNLVNVTVRKSANTASVDTAWMVRDERTHVEYNIRSVIDPYTGTPKQGRFIEMLCEKGVAK